MPPKRPQSGAGGNASKYKVAPEPTEQPPSRPRSSRNQVVPDASQQASSRPASSRPASSRPASSRQDSSQSASSRQASSRQASPSGIEVLQRTPSGRRIAWSASSATAFAPPEVRDELNAFKKGLAGLPIPIQRKIASEVPAAKWAQIQKMLSPARLPAKPEYAEFITRLQTLLAAPTTIHIRNATYEALRTFADEHGFDPKHRLDSFRLLLNFIDTRRRLIAEINAVQFEQLNEADQIRYTNIDRYRSEKSKTTPTILLTMIPLLGNPELTLLAKVYIQEALADLYAHSTDYLQGAYHRRYDIRPFVQFAFHLHEHLRIVRAARTQTETTTAYAAFLEDLQGDLVPRLDAAWDILVAFFNDTYYFVPMPARIIGLEDSVLVAFSNYMSLTKEHDAAFKAFIEKVFLHAPTVFDRAYKRIITLHNDTYSASMRAFAFSVLKRMVLLAESKLPKLKKTLRIVYIESFEGFIDIYKHYYSSKNTYRATKKDSKRYIRSYYTILKLIQDTLRLNASGETEKKAFVDDKIEELSSKYPLRGFKRPKIIDGVGWESLKTKG